MPAHRKPKSLRNQCLLWYFNLVFNQRERIDANYLPVEIVDDIMHLLSEAQVNGAHINKVYQLIELHGHHCRHIHLEFKEWVNVYPMKMEVLLTLISYNTNPYILKKFSIFGHSIPWNCCDISKCLIHLNGLTSLKLYVHNLNDQILSTISKSCHNLEELYLQGMNFTNKSIMSLAGIQDNGFKSMNQSIGCPNLRILLMLKESRTPPKFTFRAIVCLLDNLPKIEAINIPHFSLTTALIRLSTTRVQHLQALTHYSANFSMIGGNDCIKISNILHKITRLSPFLTILNITLDMKTSFQCLSPLSKLQHLNSFTITKALINNKRDNNLYEECFESNDKYSNSYELNAIIAKFGHKLNHLELHNIYAIDLKQISSLCPNLVELEVTNVKQITNKNQSIHYRPNEQMFKSIQHLKLFGHSDNRITGNNLIEVLSCCPNLRFLKIGWCSSLDDSTVDKLLSMNTLKHLNHLEFHEMSEKLTIDSIMQIVITRRMALNLHLLYCDGINCEDIDNLRQFTKEFNIDLLIKYYYD